MATIGLFAVRIFTPFIITGINATSIYLTNTLADKLIDKLYPQKPEEDIDWEKYDSFSTVRKILTSATILASILIPTVGGSYLFSRLIGGAIHDPFITVIGTTCGVVIGGIVGSCKDPMALSVLYQTICSIVHPLFKSGEV